MTYESTPEQKAGHAQHVKERDERCKRVLEAWEKKKKANVLSEKELKSKENQEKFKKWEKQ